MKSAWKTAPFNLFFPALEEKTVDWGAFPPSFFLYPFLSLFLQQKTQKGHDEKHTGIETEEERGWVKSTLQNPKIACVLSQHVFLDDMIMTT